MPGPVEYRTYRRTECVLFRKTGERFGGLSNMASGYPIRVNRVLILSAEALYQACRFPHLPDVQRLIIQEASPMTAKMRSKPYRGDSRSDWDGVRVKVMRWCLRAKLVQNWEKFSSLLLETQQRPIVEDARRDDFWGAVAMRDDPEILTGKNVLGRLLMELRELVRQSSAEQWRELRPPRISNFLLMGEPIGPVLQANAPGQCRMRFG